VHPQDLQTEGQGAEHKQEPEGMSIPGFDGLSMQQ
jgi:hypothetical protein